MPVGEADPRIGQLVDGRYRVQRLIGRGGMGTVYEAEQLALGKRVAIKFLAATADAAAQERFGREARAASRIFHENVVTIFDAGPGFIAMEYVEGPDLRRVLKGGPLAIDRAVKITREILAGLTAIHAQGIVHRDIKPANVVLEPKRRGGEQAKIMDFGIAKQLDTTTLTMVGHVMGTPQYMAPEQIYGQPVDSRADLYAVAVTLYALLSGELPYDQESFTRLAIQKSVEPARPIAQFRPDVPPHVVRAIHRALSRDPAKRFATAAEFATALATPDAPKRDAVARATRDRRRAQRVRKQRFALVGAATFALAMLGVLAYTQLRTKPVARAAPLPIATPTERAPVTPPPDAGIAWPAVPAVATRQPSTSVQLVDITDTEERDPIAPLAVRFAVDSSPPGADVYIDERRIGTTPLSLVVDPGEHRVRIQLAGHYSTIQTLELAAGSRKRLVATLRKRPAPRAAPPANQLLPF